MISSRDKSTMNRNLEKLHKVIKLAMYVSANSYRRLNRLNIALLHEQIFDLCGDVMVPKSMKGNAVKNKVSSRNFEDNFLPWNIAA